MASNPGRKKKKGVETGDGGASPDVEAQQQSDEDPRDDDVTQTQHGKVAGFQSLLQQVLRKHH